MHTIRLRGGWVVTEIDPGTARHVRRFGRPRTLAPNETVWVTVTDAPGPGTFAVNGTTVGLITAESPGTFDIRSLLRDRNELVLDIHAPPDKQPGEVALEIRDEPLTLTPAGPDDYAFTHNLTRANMERYVTKYWGGWDEAVYRANFDRTENLVLRLGGVRVGFVRTEPAGEMFVLEDLQIVPACQNRGLGAWVLEQVRASASDRGLRAVRLRCFKDNQARRLYLRAGFRVVEDAGNAEWFEATG
jgi:ribosomal protein S18 acetylase RimI-like enzyme